VVIVLILPTQLPVKTTIHTPIIVAPTQHLIILIGLALPHAALASRSGYLHLSHSSLQRIGVNSIYWSEASTSNIDSAYNLNYNNTDNHPSYYDARWPSYSVRCISF